MNVLVFNGPGVSQTSLTHTLSSLRNLLRSGYAVETISASALASQPWAPSCALLVLPGGRDTPYVSALAAANHSIKSYVQKGGCFLGLCAGAYYASRRVEWEAGTDMEVVGDRPLGFYPGISEGCVYKGFDYQTEAGARALTAETTGELDGTLGPLRGVYYNGGGHFVGADTLRRQGVVPLIRYTEDDGADKVATVWCGIDKGAAVLSHLHLECSILLEPAASALARASPTLSETERVSIEAVRCETLRSLLRLLGLRIPDGPSLPPKPFVPLPQVLIGSPSTTYIGKAFMDRLESNISKTSQIMAYKSLQDQNDTFRIYELPQIGTLINEARRDWFEGAEIPNTFPKSILISGEGQLSSPNDTPLFNISQYFEALSAQHRASSMSTPSSASSHKIGEVLLYGELVTSTQSLLDKYVLWCLSSQPNLKANDGS
jgi:biotin---protein ligase